MQGSGQALLNIVELLNDMEIDVYIVLPNARGVLYQIIRDRKINYFIVPVVPWIWPRLEITRDFILLPLRLSRLLLNSLFSYVKLLNITRKVNPSIIHTNVGVIHIGFYVAKRLKIPHVWHIREFQDLDFGWKPFPSSKFFLKLLQESNNYPIAITKEVYNHHMLNKNNNARVIYDGIFHVDAIPRIINQKEKYFLFVGHLSEGKGIKDAVLAFISIATKYPDYQLWLAGKSSVFFENEIEKIILQKSYQDQIKYLGFRTDIYSLMSKATALIVSSRHEGFGFITAEAMFNGCLVIGKNTAGTKEQFDNGLKIHGSEIGLRFNTQTELSCILENLCINGHNDYQTLIHKAQETVVTLYSKKNNVDYIVKLYNEIII